MARTDRTPRDETTPDSATPRPFAPGQRRPGQPSIHDSDGGPITVSDEDQGIAADMLQEYGPAFDRLADL